MENQYLIARELAKELDVSTMSFIRAMNRMHLTDMFNRWNPHELTQTDKDIYVQAYTNLFEYQ